MNFFDRLEHGLIIMVSRLAPWAAPLAPAFLVAKDDTAFVIILLCHYALLWTFYLFLYNYLEVAYPGIILDYDGIVYLLRRADGIFKIGCTVDLTSRIQAHRQDYGMDFELIKSWLVQDRYYSERKALRLTRQFHYAEGSRLELRRMTWKQCQRFIHKFKG